jgi:hypothetical protein
MTVWNDNNEIDDDEVLMYWSDQLLTACFINVAWNGNDDVAAEVINNGVAYNEN